MEFEVKKILPDLIGKRLMVSLDAPQNCHVSISGIPFDPPGNQTEEQLLALGRAAAKEVLLAAAAAL